MEKKKFDVLVNITVATTVYDVEAENDEQAETIAKNYIGDDYTYYLKEADMLVDYEVVEVNEQDGGDTEQKSEQTPKQPSVWVFTAEQCYDMQMFDVVVRTFATEKAARKFLHDFIHEDCGDGSIVDMVKEKGWDIDEDEPNHYYAGIEGSYLSNRVECTITECRIES